MSLRDEGIDFEARFRGDRIHLLCQSIASFREAQRFLARKNYNFHTFTLQEDAEVKATIRGIHHSTDPEVICADLKSQGYHPTHVMPLPRRSAGDKLPTNSFFVKIKKIGKWDSFWAVTYVLGVRVTVTPFEPMRGAPNATAARGLATPPLIATCPQVCQVHRGTRHQNVHKTGRSAAHML